MNVDGKPYLTIWLNNDGKSVGIIDQTRLPHDFCVTELRDLNDFCRAITDMLVRGAPLIGATAAFGLAMYLQEDASAKGEEFAAQKLLATRPTAINLHWAIQRVRKSLEGLPENQKAAKAIAMAQHICQEDIDICSRIGDTGLDIIQQLSDKKAGKTINILTHCNAGWLATVDWGTALAPIYKAFNAGIDVHVWVDETRPRNQGAFLTAWELNHHGVPHTLIPDNTGGHLMQHGDVDLCIVGTDRTTATGDVCNKIGTYLKALAAFDNNIPFYVSAPTPSIDWTISDGVKEIPIEERSHKEVSHIGGLNSQGDIDEVQLVTDGTPVANYGFDVTPSRLVTGLFTEFGLFKTTEEEMQALRLKALA